MGEQKRYEELMFKDNFMFCKVLENRPDLCRELIELLIGEKIGQIAALQQQKSFEAGFDARGVRFDVHAKDDASRVYDIEMQTYKEDNWAKRSRFYSSNMDIEQLDKGMPVEALNDTWVVFICDFQILPQYNLAKYTFQKVCEQQPDYKLEDGTHMIMLCARNQDESISRKLQSFLRFIADGTVEDDFTKRLQEAVQQARISKEWRREYMLLTEYIAKERAEGREEGREEGRVEGERSGETRTSTLTLKLLQDGRQEDLVRSCEDPDFRRQLLQEYGLV